MRRSMPFYENKGTTGDVSRVYYFSDEYGWQIEVSQSTLSHLRSRGGDYGAAGGALAPHGVTGSGGKRPFIVSRSSVGTVCPASASNWEDVNGIFGSVDITVKCSSDGQGTVHH